MKCLCASTRKAARLLTKYYEEELRPANLTPAQFELLATLAARTEWPQGELAETLGVDQTTLSRNLKVMAGRKWVKAGASVKDRRQVLYALTAEGQRAFRDAIPHWKRAQSNMQKRLGSEWTDIGASIDRLLSVIDP